MDAAMRLFSLSSLGTEGLLALPHSGKHMEGDWLTEIYQGSSKE